MDTNRLKGRAYSNKDVDLSNWLGACLNSCHKFVQTAVAQACLLCGGRSLAGLLCEDCARSLPLLQEACCPVCALPIYQATLCGGCLHKPPAFDRTQALFSYAFPVDVLIQHLKYGGQIALAQDLAERLAGKLSVLSRPDCIVPMPLHPRRLHARGFNQAALLAAHLADRLNVAHAPRACRRVRDTPPQVDLPVKARHKNIKGAFVCEADLEGKHVALVDDVMTTGASLDELARAVRLAGASEVSVWVVARAVKHPAPAGFEQV